MYDSPSTAPKGSEKVPDGVASCFFHDEVEVGDILRAKAPRGGFFLDSYSNKPIVLIGSGIGVTPLISMVNAVVHHDPRREVHLFLGFRNGAAHPFKEHLLELASRYPSIHLHVAYSRPDPIDREGLDYHSRGRLSVSMVNQHLAPESTTISSVVPGQ